MFAIEEQKLYTEVRNEIVRDLVTHIYGHNEKPTPTFVTKVAKLLVEKYPFMRDSSTSSGATNYVMIMIVVIKMHCVHYNCFLGIVG